MVAELNDFIDELVNARNKLGITLAELSEMTGISVSYISLLENKKRKNPKLEILNKLAEVLQVENVLKDYNEKNTFVQYLYPQSNKRKAPTTVEEKIEYLQARLINQNKLKKLEVDDMIYFMQLIKDIVYT